MNTNEVKIQEIQNIIFNLSVEYSNLTVQKFSQVFDSTVKYGSFKGLKLDYSELDETNWDLSLCSLSKFIGQFEIEIQPWIQQSFRKHYDLVINLGCSDGFYALGFAINMPKSKVFGFEQNENYKKRFERNIVLNELKNVESFGVCDFENLKKILKPASKKKTLLFLDIEGSEVEFLDLYKIANLKYCDIIVEIHDFVCKDVEVILKERFKATHEIEVVAQAGRNPHVKELEFLPEPVKFILMSEYRPPNMKWMRLKAKKIAAD